MKNTSTENPGSNFGLIMNDALYLKRCLDLAARGKGFVSPNPMVGACLVMNDQVIGEGYHRAWGQSHAEPNAIESVPGKWRELIPEATLYISMEPCSFEGKTPACTALIIRQGIKKVVVGCLDPNPKVNGKGVAILREAGTGVKMAEDDRPFRWLNRAFEINQRKDRPYVILKFARSADGYIGKKEKQVWLSNDLSKRLAHRWRAEVDAILTGSGTVLTDDPALTVRLAPGDNPLRVILDPGAKISPGKKVFDGTAPTLLFTRKKRDDLPQQLKQIEMNGDSWHPADIGSELMDNKVGILLVEGGANTIERFVRTGYWDECRIIDCPVTLGSGIEAPPVYGRQLHEENIQGDVHRILMNPRSLELLNA